MSELDSHRNRVDCSVEARTDRDGACVSIRVAYVYLVDKKFTEALSQLAAAQKHLDALKLKAEIGAKG